MKMTCLSFHMNNIWENVKKACSWELLNHEAVTSKNKTRVETMAEIFPV